MDRSESIVTKIFQYLAKGSLTNRHGVTFEVQDEFSISAEVRILSTRVEVDLFYEFFDKKEMFVDAFNLRDIYDLHALSTTHLRQLYLAGKASIVCQVNLKYSYLLSFRLVNGNIVAENERLIKHEVKEELTKPEDFVKYTLNYYKLIDSCEN